jgi:hypothetical protein
MLIQLNIQQLDLIIWRLFHEQSVRAYEQTCKRTILDFTVHYELLLERKLFF